MSMGELTRYVDGAGTANQAAAAQNPLYGLIELPRHARPYQRPLRSAFSPLLPVRCRENLEQHVVDVGEGLDVDVPAVCT
jgi:hypothetical protein